MDHTTLTVRVPRHLPDAAKRCAEGHDTTLTRLITEYLRQLCTHDGWLTDAPTVRRLTGVLSREVSEEEYREHLWRKYGG